MASIRKIGKNKWKVTVYVGQDASGKQLRDYATCSSEAEAKQVARDMENDVKRGDLSAVSMMRAQDWFAHWMRINKPLLAPTTIKAYRLYVDKHFTPAFGDMKLCDITDLHIKSYIADKLADLSPTTVRKHFFTLQKILFDALKHNSPMVGIKAPKQGDYKPRVASEDEFEQIRKAFAALGLEHEAVILLAGWCGMRRGEIFALKWDDINEKEGYIRVDEALALAEDDYKFETKEPKSANGKRVIATPPYLFDLLGRIKKQTSPPKKRKKRVVQIDEKRQPADISPFVFNLTPGSWSNLYVKTMKDNNLPPIRFHNLRHYHASILFKHGVPDLYAAERLGHDISVLKGIYQHLGLKERKELDDKVRGLF